MTQELYKIHRPKLLKHVIGQPEAVAKLNAYVKKNRLPHSILISGPSGCGKTTIARILKNKVECSDQDFTEVNSADFRGIDKVREIRSRMSLRPIGGKTRVWLIDECHKLSNDAQNAMLKLLEDTPKHVYFFLATTDPQKLIAPVRNRCTDIVLKPISNKDLAALLERVCKKEKLTISEEVAEALVEAAEGSARKLLVLLDAVKDITDDEERLHAIASSTPNKEAIELARALLNPKTKWVDIGKILKSIEADPEDLRWMVLAYATSVLIGGGKMSGRAFIMINAFRDNFYDCKKAGLAAACYEVIHG